MMIFGAIASLFHTVDELFYFEAVPIGFFAIIDMVITIFLIGIPFGFIFGVPLIDALLFGAILAATDPVAVGAIFKRFPIPHRLNVIIEGESLFNDGTCVISVNRSFSARNIPVQRNIRYDYRYIDRY